MRELPQSGLLMVAVFAMVAGVLGSVMMKRVPLLGRILRTGSTFALIGVLVLVVLQLSRLDPRFSLAVPEIGLPEQVVEGRETRIPMHIDGHYWLEADVNGHRAAFLVDTGATLTAVSQDTARAAGLDERDGGLPIRLNTANGVVAAHMTNIDEMRFGNVAARGLDAVIAPGLGQTNVIGMNLLSRLASVRIENNELILTPNNPQPVLEPSD
ncbi:peptidase [Aurantiacibacter marinus]|uniref:Peptidase n=1 Tax=Aurantiacibacter marinus TaxID=874156 RepID=A0A0H0XUS3_9SPHN|nr:peptidase [Aurantiacibacter marinus]